MARMQRFIGDRPDRHYGPDRPGEWFFQKVKAFEPGRLDLSWNPRDRVWEVWFLRPEEGWYPEMAAPAADQRLLDHLGAYYHWRKQEFKRRQEARREMETRAREEAVRPLEARIEDACAEVERDWNSREWVVRKANEEFVKQDIAAIERGEKKPMPFNTRHVDINMTPIWEAEQKAAEAGAKE